MERKSTEMRTFYTSKMSPPNVTSLSNSPLKPTLFMDYLFRVRTDIFHRLDIFSDFEPFGREDFEIAHSKEYVADFLIGKEPMCSSSNIKWTQELVDSVGYSIASLYHALRYANEMKRTCFSPTSGFHHAIPSSGMDFCTFSGQVIASVKLYREQGLVGGYFDLDGHFGNSIEDSRKFVKDLNLAIPKGANINPTGVDHSYYRESFWDGLMKLDEMITNNKIDYIVYCHGADSHEDDDLGVGVLTTKEWLDCTRLFMIWLHHMNLKRTTPLPVVFCLFGGYRKNYDKVLELHANDLSIILDGEQVRTPV